jgi:hypothetical protein
LNSERKENIMNKPIALILLVVGVILTIYGISASDSVGSGFSRVFTGAPTQKTIGLLLGGLAVGVIGLAGMLHGSRQ